LEIVLIMIVVTKNKGKMVPHRINQISLQSERLLQKSEMFHNLTESATRDSI